jgi:uncharacterized YigZ family protein
VGFSDDGEPSGTAGKPILAQLQGSGIGEITAVVCRYFGGIKLGTGGLVRAYGGTVASALAQLETRERRIMGRVAISADYGDMALLEFLLGEFEGLWLEVEYGAGVTGTLSIEARVIPEFCRQLLDRSQGRLKARPLEQALD